MKISPVTFSTPPKMEGGYSGFPVLLGSGDLQIHVTYSNQSLIWSGFSSSLCQASPVWNKMLSPPFQQLTRKEGVDDYGMREKRINLQGDSGEALLILLRVAHCQFSLLPSEIEFETILEMAVLCDRYDCVELVKPWLDSWLVNEQSECYKPGQEGWLFIAWVFGRKKFLQGMAKKLMGEMTFNDDGEGLTSTGETFPALMPPDIMGMLPHFLSKPRLESFLLTQLLLLESIISIRQATIKELLKVTYDYFDLFLKEDSVCCQSSSRKACNALMCGSLVIGLHELGLWPRKSPDTINLSVQDLASKLTSLVIWTYPSNNCKNHYNCGSTSLSDRIKSTLQFIPNPVFDRHMRAQQPHREPRSNSTTA